MIYEKQDGVPRFESNEFANKTSDYVVLIPVINEGERIALELKKAYEARVYEFADIVICDGGSKDGSLEPDFLREVRVNTLLTKKDVGKQGAQFRMGLYWAFERGYKGIITIDGNNKDSIEDVPKFIDKLEEGYVFIQGSRFVKGGKAINTPFIRLVAVRLIHAPLISLAARQWFTDTTNAYRAYSVKYLKDERVKPLRDVFMTYELLAFLSVRATQIGLKACEIPVSRAYPKTGKTPTKISFFKGNSELFSILIKCVFGKYNP